MGRRKIEIQPILHDRNRSVTFLKRKNGLFKKAYELGVLCSVDVLVVVFGHNQKLYEYCSSSNGNPGRILDKRVHFGGEREGKGPNDFSGEKSTGADDDDNEDVDLPEGSDDAHHAPQSNRRQSSSKSQNHKSSYPARGRSGSPVGTSRHDDELVRMDHGTHSSQHDRGTVIPEAPLQPALPLHIAQLLAAAASGTFDPSRQHQQNQGLIPGYNDQNQVNVNAVAAASNLGAQLAQLIAGNPYMASQLTLPNILSLGALGLNPGGNTNVPSNPLAGFGASGFGGANPPANGPGGLHPLYSTPLFASLLQQSQQQQQQAQASNQQNQASNISASSLLFPSIPSDSQDKRDRDRPPSSSDSSSRGGLKVDWPAPHSYRDPEPSRPRSPDQQHQADPSPSNSGMNGAAVGGSTFIDFLNAISNAGGAGQVTSGGQSLSSTMAGNSSQANLGSYGIPGLSSTGNIGLGGMNLGMALGGNAQNQLGNLGLLGSLGLGMGLPGGGAFPPGAFGGLGGGGAGSSQDRSSQPQPSQNSSRKRPRNDPSYDDMNPEVDFPLSSALSELPFNRSLDRYMNQDDEDGGGSRHRDSGVDMDEDDHPDVKGRSDALHVDLRGNGYEEDVSGVRASKRGRPG